jgi:peptidoglycan lytic transglycosylase G
MVERRPGVMPPKPGPPPRQVPPGRLMRRRAAAIAGVVIVVAVVFALVKVTSNGSSSTPPATTVVAPPKPFRIVFPEGFSRAEMAQRVQAVALIAQHKRHNKKVRLSKRAYLLESHPRHVAGFGPKKRSLEGFLFPATYDFLAGTTSAQLVQQQLDAFAENWSKVNLSYARKKNLTPYDVLIIASLVEKEALVPDERPKIARVIYNRLHAHMNLGIDATTRYGLHVPGTKSLTQSELESNNPYNTRNPDITGLPPTPIANPGLASMQAAAHPAPGDWLYFVRKPDLQHHYFTANYNDFINHANQYGFH